MPRGYHTAPIDNTIPPSRVKEATARTPELAIHLRMARRQGWGEDELIEVLLHLSGYVGVPLIREAMLTAKEVFGEMRKER